MTVQAITFDLWDTVFVDESDEPKRLAQGLKPKGVARRDMVAELVGAVDRNLVDVAYDTTDAAFRQVWYSQNITWTVRDRLGVVLKGLGAELGDEAFDRLVGFHEDMELGPMPDLAVGVKDALEALHGKYKLGVISDAIFSPGRALVKLLDHYGLTGYFDSFIFSDEIGFAKPTPIIFETAAKELGVDVSELAHIGDRPAKDIAGPQALGAKGILCTVVKDRSSEDVSADAVCRDFADLPEIICNLK